MGPSREPGTFSQVVHPYALAGTWAAASEVRGVGIDNEAVDVIAVDVRTGQSRECLVGEGSVPGGPRVGQPTVSHTGRMRWSARAGSGTTTGSC